MCWAFLLQQRHPLRVRIPAAAGADPVGGLSAWGQSLRSANVLYSFAPDGFVLTSLDGLRNQIVNDIL